MAIAFDAVSTGGANATSVTVSHVCGGDNRILFAQVSAAAANPPSGVTYNGTAMTEIGHTASDDGTCVTYLYYLIAPASGTHNLVASHASSGAIVCAGISYTGALQSGQPDASVVGLKETATSFSKALTSIANNCWHMCCSRTGNGYTLTAGDNTTVRQQPEQTFLGAGAFWDSNSAKTPAGEVTLTVTCTSQHFGGALMVTIAPYLAQTTLTETVKSISSRIAITNKTLSQIVKSIASFTKLPNKNFAQAIVLNPILSNVVTLIRTFSENFTTIGIAVKQGIKTCLGTIKITPIFSFVGTFLKEFIEVIVSVSSRIGETAKTFIESVISGDIFDKVLSAVKTLAETIKTFGTIQRSTGRTLEQNLAVNDTGFSIQRFFLEIYSETVRVVSSLISSIGKLLIDTIMFAGGLIHDASRTFVESVVAVEKILFQISRTLIDTVKVVLSFTTFLTISKICSETIKIFSVRAFQRMRIITETVVVIFQNIFDATRILTETIITSSTKVFQSAIIRTEHLVVRVVSVLFAIARTFIERILGNTWFEFMKTQYTELTDHLTAGVTFIKATTRLFVERVKMASDVIIKYMGRLFEEVVGVNTSSFQDELRLLFGHVCYEVVNTIGALGEWVIGKLLPEIVKIYHSIGKASAWLMTEIINVVSSMVLSTGKIFVEIVSVLSAKIFAMGRIFTQVVKGVVSWRFKKTQFTVLTDHLRATSALLRAIGRTIVEVLIIMAALGGWAIGKLFIQPIRILSEYSRAWTLGRVITEVVRVMDSYINQGINVFFETVTMTGTFVLGTISKVMIEVVKIIQFVGNTLPARIYTEIIRIAENSYNQAGKIFSEVVNVVGQFVLGTISKLFIEPIKVIVEYTKVWTLSRVFSEIVRVIGNAFTEGGLIFSEVVSVVGTFILGTISKLLLETVIIAHSAVSSITRVFSEIVVIANNALNQAGKIFAEVAAVVGPAITKSIGRTITSIVKVGSSLVRAMSRTFTQVVRVIANISQMGGSYIFYETIKVVGAMAGSTVGKLLQEIVVAGWAKIKLVKNGIQVGLWKKVARVTVGAWRKISRNDN